MQKRRTVGRRSFSPDSYSLTPDYYALGVLYHIADSANRRDHLVMMLGVDLLAKMIDDDIDNVRPWIEVITPRILSDQRATHDAATVSHEILQDGVFLGCQLDQLSAATDLPRALIELEITDRELVRRERLRPARQRLHSREKLLERERFRHVIVGACA